VVAFNAAEGWSRDVSEDIAGEIIDRACDADETPPSDSSICTLIISVGRGRHRCYASSGRPQEGAGGVDTGDRCLDTSAMGVRTRGLDIKAGAAKLKADRAARIEAELVVDRWNRRLATGRDMLWSPIRAA
jgi:hypothetical protein